MKKVIFYEIFLLICLIIFFYCFNTYRFPTWVVNLKLSIQCVMMSMLGGLLYCIRAIYINKCVKNNWNKDWHLWYYLRPIASMIVGFLAYMFLKAGLLVLDASENHSSGDYGYFIIAFLAGLNVDKFMIRLEEVGKSMFGIEPSRMAKNLDIQKGEEIGS
ncbi:hypothetical protein CYJ96_10055 [Moraxella osloensis]|uniref:Uncharacterized protein n=2 Tax=Faucicola osloensis TaxID=34062 RepID=A0A2I1RG62_FAUOS|nr:hypothetical protein CYJ96_10055 [Moraxella osloensis]TGP42993.1 hypothetical protein EN873_44815 [bacterium M00.F.Ca.ET.230.01.1.1]